MECSIYHCLSLVYEYGLCRSHYNRHLRYGDPLAVKRATPTERLWRQSERRDGHWIWTGTAVNHGGQLYGQFWLNGAMWQAHGAAYELLVGPIPDGTELDHLCRVTLCVYPAHLEPVSHRENVLRGDSPAARNARKTHCPQGHPYAGDNLIVRANGGRVCRECSRIHAYSYTRRKRRLGRRKMPWPDLGSSGVTG